MDRNPVETLEWHVYVLHFCGANLHVALIEDMAAQSTMLAALWVCKGWEPT